jgi:hypothetical protein
MTPVTTWRCPTCAHTVTGRLLMPPWCRHLNTPHDAKPVKQMRQDNNDS